VTAPRARILRGEEATRGAPLLAPGAAPAQMRRIAREVIEARLEAERVVQAATERAEAILAHAHAQALSAGAEAAKQAGAEADARLAARWIALRAAEGKRLEGDADRVIPVAVALAERLLGATLELAPERIAAIAAGVLAEARGARRAVITAHPLDAEALRAHLVVPGLDARDVEVRTDEGLARGALRLHTDVGIIDAQLSPRLERLADAIRDALR
jgi:flagellar biosynthesis/type III secretory pathway protein FliH